MHDASTLQCITGTSPALDESALVEAAQDSPTAFGVLYHRYLNRIYAYLRARCANAEDAADLTQQVFLRALDALPSYRGTRDGAFAAWLFRIARNVAVDDHRRHHGTIAWDLLPEALQPAMEHDLAADLLRREASERLRHLFAQLDADTRELLLLRFAARLSIAELAAVVGKSEAATQKKLFRAIRALKERYDDDSL